MGGYPLGYLDIRQDFRGKGASAPAGGYPLALAGIRQQITDIRNGLSATISNDYYTSAHCFCALQLFNSCHPAHLRRALD
ncbi:hypothetical protein PGT21_013650 [Puccinia graminis f. sp. tritici]|uniref:Uncharacterized protein n=1 Tax=Puccinia graminis f. sp. tritici TaxID=56615 RepID=A0A5B0LLG2_PUCGR|nr:hypothetical protein PGT21_013650 [Puccinia graminis f. sp. tritici]